MHLTVKGSPITKTQVTTAEVLLGEAKQDGAGQIASEAIIYAGMGETSLGADASTYQPNGYATSYSPQGFWGVLQGAVSNWPDAHDTAGMAKAFLRGDSGKGFQAGGAMTLARQGVTNPAEIAIRVEVPSIWPDDAYAKEWPGGQAQGLSEAKAIVVALGGGALKGGVAGAGGTGTVPDGSPNSTAPFAIGTSSNPSEDVWTGDNRLAQEVNWYLFTDGESLYYMDGEEIIAQRPAMTLDRVQDADRIPSGSGTFDNTAFGYVSAHKRKFTLQHKTKVQTVTSPTSFQMDLICGIDEVRGGDVIELSSFGPLDGRWIVADCTRSVFAIVSTLTLVPPIAPITEAAVAGTTGKKQSAPSGTSTATGKPTGNIGNLASPFTKKYTATLANTDQGADFGRQQGIATGDPILAIGDCYCRSTQPFYVGSINPQALWFELVDKSAGYWGWYLAEEMDAKVGVSPNLIKQGTVIATYAAAGTGIEIGWAAGPGLTATRANHPGELATRHDGNGTTDGRAFLVFLKQVGAIS